MCEKKTTSLNTWYWSIYIYTPVSLLAYHCNIFAIFHVPLLKYENLCFFDDPSIYDIKTYVFFIVTRAFMNQTQKMFIKGLDLLSSLGIYSNFMQKALHKNFHLQPCLGWINKDQRMNIFVSSRVQEIFQIFLSIYRNETSWILGKNKLLAIMYYISNEIIIIDINAVYNITSLNNLGNST